MFLLRADDEEKREREREKRMLEANVMYPVAWGEGSAGATEGQTYRRGGGKTVRVGRHPNLGLPGW